MITVRGVLSAPGRPFYFAALGEEQAFSLSPATPPLSPGSLSCLLLPRGTSGLKAHCRMFSGPPIRLHS